MRCLLHIRRSSGVERWIWSRRAQAADIIHERAEGIDISQCDAKVAIRVPGKRKGTFVTNVSTWGSTTSQVFELIDYLVNEQVTTVVMERPATTGSRSTT